MSAEELTYLTFKLNSFDHPINFDFYYDLNSLSYPDLDGNFETDITEN